MSMRIGEVAEFWCDATVSNHALTNKQTHTHAARYKVLKDVLSVFMSEVGKLVVLIMMHINSLKLSESSYILG